MERVCRPDVFGAERAANLPNRCRRTIRLVWRLVESWEPAIRPQPDSLAMPVHDLIEYGFRQTHPAYDTASVNEPTWTMIMHKCVIRA